MYKKIILASFIVLGFSASAQFSPRIGTARPGNTPGPNAVGKNILQIQQGYSFLDMTLSEPLVTDEFVLGQQINDSLYGQTVQSVANVFRYGISERLEARMRINYFNQNFKAEGNGIYGTADQNQRFTMDFGARLNLFNDADLGRNFGIQADAGFSQGLSGEANASWMGSALFLFNQGFGNFTFTSNLGVQLAQQRNERYLIRNSLRYVTGDVLLHVGVNTDVANVQNQPYRVNPIYFWGVGYFLGNNLQFDVQFSYGVVDSPQFSENSTSVKEYTVEASAGVSWRLNFRK